MSSTIKSIEYKTETQELQVEFHSGGTYRYKNVPAEEHEKFKNAESLGSHLHRYIKGAYPCEKVETKEEAK